MTDLSNTLVGDVVGVRGNTLTVRLRAKTHAAMLIGGESYRVGQVGAFVRIPVGYTDLFAICVQVNATEAGSHEGGDLEGYASITASLFGEALAGVFERGVSRYPTIGDGVHVATQADVDVIYGRALGRDRLTIGRIASTQGLAADLQLSSLVTRHTAVVGSTGSGKSNLVAVILEELATSDLKSARTLVIDPHGEYSDVLPDSSNVVRSRVHKGEDPSLHVPYWALPMNQLLSLTMGELSPSVIEQIRDRVRELKVVGASYLTDPPAESSITADSPVPFSIWKLWFELEDDERRTYSDSQKQDASTMNSPIDVGDPMGLVPPRYPAPTSTNTAPYPNRARRNISRQLGLLRGRLRDPRFAFMFNPNHPTSPDLDGRVSADLDSVLEEWIGSTRPITVLDVSGLPSEALGAVVGTMIQIIYDALFWAVNLPVGGRAQPLLIVVDEAHLFLPNGVDSPAHRAFSRIAKEGRKYGVGLMAVTQRPADIDVDVLSQSGTFLALRLTNGSDRAAIANAIPDDLNGLAQMLPSLKTGEALVLGEALQVPSRVQVRRSRHKPVGDDPSLPTAWLSPRPSGEGYAKAVRNWRLQTTSDEDGE